MDLDGGMRTLSNRLTCDVIGGVKLPGMFATGQLPFSTSISQVRPLHLASSCYMGGTREGGGGPGVRTPFLAQDSVFLFVD